MVAVTQADLDAYLKTSLHLIKGRICSIAVAIDDGEPTTMHAGDVLAVQAAEEGYDPPMDERWDDIDPC